jgi:hypothetical protein
MAMPGKDADYGICPLQQLAPLQQIVFLYRYSRNLHTNLFSSTLHFQEESTRNLNTILSQESHREGEGPDPASLIWIRGDFYGSFPYTFSHKLPLIFSGVRVRVRGA